MNNINELFQHYDWATNLDQGLQVNWDPGTTSDTILGEDPIVTVSI